MRKQFHQHGLEKNPAGFTIIEMMVALVVVTAALGLGVEMIRSMSLTWSGLAQVSARENRIDSAIFNLRRDVWNSRQMTLADHSNVELTTGDAGKLAWHIEGDGRISRTDAGGGVRSWEATAQGWQFQGDDVSLTIRDTKNPGEIPMRLTSQILLAGRVKP